jgi:uncharacterized phage protein (TIGR02216 family)
MSFPWTRIMRLGLCELRLPPEQFWRMTLRELAVAAGHETADLGNLRRLMNEEIRHERQ